MLKWIFLVDVIFKGFSNARSLPSIFHNFFVCKNEVETLCDPLCMERLQCTANFQVHRNTLWSNAPCNLNFELAWQTMFVLCFGGKIYMICWLLSQEVWKDWSHYEELVPSFHDFTQLNASPHHSTPLWKHWQLKATLLLNKYQVPLFLSVKIFSLVCSVFIIQ